MPQNDEKQIEQAILFEITELDDAALDAVSGGLYSGDTVVNESQCSCTVNNC